MNVSSLAICFLMPLGLFEQKPNRSELAFDVWHPKTLFLMEYCIHRFSQPWSYLLITAFVRLLPLLKHRDVQLRKKTPTVQFLWKHQNVGFKLIFIKAPNGIKKTFTQRKQCRSPIQSTFRRFKVDKHTEIWPLHWTRTLHVFHLLW